MKNQLLYFKQWLNESFKYHSTLSPTVWKIEYSPQKEFLFDENIREKLLDIADDFWKSLKLDVEIIDIQLTGSLANFNWTSSSDLDIHIIIDFYKVDNNFELVRKALDGQRFIWNQRHPVIIKGHDVECYVQHKDEEHISSGLFSLLNNKWIIKPIWDPPSVDQKDIDEKIRVIKSEFNEIKREISETTGDRLQVLYDYLKRFKSKITKTRKAALEEKGEYTIENLVFKELRRDGTIEDIINLESKTYFRIYSE